MVHENELCYSPLRGFHCWLGAFGDATEWVVDASGIWKAKVQADAKPTTMNEANYRTKTHPAPNVNSVEEECRAHSWLWGLFHQESIHKDDMQTFCHWGLTQLILYSNVGSSSVVQCIFGNTENANVKTKGIISDNNNKMEGFVPLIISFIHDSLGTL